MRSHLNRENKPLCGKATWIEDGDNLSKSGGNCEECTRLLRKEEWTKRTPESKEKSFAYIMRKLLTTWMEEVEEMVSEGYEIHQHKRYPKTEGYIKATLILKERPNLSYFLGALLSAINHVSCHHNKTKEGPGDRETCLDCNAYRIFWYKDNEEEYGGGFGPPREKIYGIWTLDMGGLEVDKPS
jgi:hypothetical protein